MCGEILFIKKYFMNNLIIFLRIIIWIKIYVGNIFNNI